MAFGRHLFLLVGATVLLVQHGAAEEPKADTLIFDPFDIGSGGSAPAKAPAKGAPAAPKGAPGKAVQRTLTEAPSKKLAEEESDAKKILEGTTPSVQNAVEVIKLDMVKMINTRHFQPAVGAGCMLFGLICLWDGKRIFKLLVVFSIFITFFFFALSQLRNDWNGKIALLTRPFASAEVGLFVGAAAYYGWDGTQLILGLVLGLYLFHNLQIAATKVPYIEEAAAHSLYQTIVCTLAVLFGSWCVNEKRGAGRVLGILCPVFGASFVVAAMGYFGMFACTYPQVQKSVHFSVLRADVPSVFDFWYMIACPMHSQAVGYFTYTNRNVVLPNQNLKLHLDRIIGIFAWFVIASMGICYQLQKDRRARRMGTGLKAPLNPNKKYGAGPSDLKIAAGP